MSAPIPPLGLVQRMALKDTLDEWGRRPHGFDGRVWTRLAELGLVEFDEAAGTRARLRVRRTATGRRALGLEPLPRSPE